MKKRIYQVPVQPQTMDEWQDDLELKRTRWGKYFSKNQEFEFFAMLPLNDEQRGVLLDAMIKDHRFQQELKTCTGTAGSSQEHRRHCIHCVLVEKASLAQPLFV